MQKHIAILYKKNAHFLQYLSYQVYLHSLMLKDLDPTY